MEKRNRICWRNEERKLSAGNALGYATHTKFMRKYCGRIMDFDPEAKTALIITPGDKFTPVGGRFNILFTMWEFMDLPKSYVKGLNMADAIVVPCRFCKDLFKQYTDNPIEVCWEGVEPERFPYHKRKPDPKVFRYLWVGAPNPRKGYPLILEAIKLYENVPNVEIYIKTTVQKTNYLDMVKNIWNRRKQIFRSDQGKTSFKRMLKRIPHPHLGNKVQRFGKYQNIIFDTRNIPFTELLELYNSANCFVLPSFGEGWGLTLCEAMSTGSPCISPNHTGMGDFFDESVGYVLNCDLKTQTLSNYDNLKTKGYVPDTRNMIELMEHVRLNYAEALKKGERASERIHRKFTWEKSAKRLNELVGGWNGTYS